MSPRRAHRPNSLSSPSHLQREGRRHHSRLGCKTCKDRKVKCDERRPLCSRCARLSLTIDRCDFEPLPAQQSRQRGSSTSSSASEESEDSSRTGSGHTQKLLVRLSSGSPLQPSMSWRPRHSSDSFRALELRLMHHYSLNTCLELPDRDDDRGKQIWRVDVPKMAFDYDFTLSAMLSLSALHLASLVPHDQSLIDACQYYFGKSVIQYREALARPYAATAAPLVATALLSALHFWVSSYNTVPDASAPATPYLQCCMLIRGGLEMFFNMQHWLRGTEYEWFWQESLKAGSAKHQETPFAVAYQQSLNLLLATIDDTTPPEDADVYITAAKCLNQVSRALASDSPQRRVQWYAAMLPLVIPRRYSLLLAREDPRALAIWAHNNAIVHIIDYTWWLHGPKGNLVMAGRLRDTFKNMPEEWRFLLKLPMDVVFGSQAAKL